MTADASTDADRIASNEASFPDATSAPEFAFSPCFFTYLPSASFTITATAMMIRDTIL